MKVSEVRITGDSARNVKDCFMLDFDVLAIVLWVEAMTMKAVGILA